MFSGSVKVAQKIGLSVFQQGQNEYCVQNIHICLHLHKQVLYHRLLTLCFPIRSELAFVPFVPTFQFCLDFVHALSLTCRKSFSWPSLRACLKTKAN